MLRLATSFGKDSGRGRAGYCPLACSSRRTRTAFEACPRSLCQCENLAPTRACRSVLCCCEEIRTSWEVVGALQFEAGTAGGQIDNVTVNRHRLRAKKDFPDTGNQTPGSHTKPASFVRPVHLSATIESLHLYGPLITDPLRRGA